MQAPEHLAGKTAKCPKCASPLPIPAPTAAAAARAAPSSSEDPVRRTISQSVDIPAPYREKLERDLEDGEQIIWTGQPSQRVIFLRNSGWLILSGFIVLAWLVVLILAALGVSMRSNVAYFVLSGLCLGAFFLPVCFLMVLVPLAKASRSYYILTSRRALVWKPGLLFGRYLNQYSIQQLARYRRINAWMPAGGGDLVFYTIKETTTRHMGGFQGPVISESVRWLHYGFLNLAEVTDIERLLRATVVDPFLAVSQRAQRRLDQLNELD
jgi:hypothetical protein